MFVGYVTFAEHPGIDVCLGQSGLIMSLDSHLKVQAVPVDTYNINMIPITIRN